MIANLSGERTETFFAQRETPEWAAAWALLATHIQENGLGTGTDLAQPDPDWGECWQYMGSTRVGGDVHCFRHRRHPATGRLEYAHV